MNPEAKDVTLPIQSVTLTEDRGLVSRRGILSWPGGAGALHIRAVAPVLVDASLQCLVHHGDLQIARVAAHRRWTPETIDGVAPLELAVQAEQQRKTILQRNHQLHQRQERRLRATELLRRYAQQVSWVATLGNQEAERWRADLDDLEALIFSALNEEVAAAEIVHEAQEMLSRIQSARGRIEEGWRLSAEIELLLDGPEASVDLEVRYLVPAAMWRPSYRAHLTPSGQLELTALATVWQRTGEDWSQVQLTLSTARPSAGATLPPLHYDRLTLRDKTSEERRTIQAHFHEQQIQQASLVDGDEPHALPGVNDGGEVRQLIAQRPVDVPADGRPRQVAVAQIHAAVQPQFVCVPEHKTLVFGRVELINTLRTPLLAGPVALITDGGPSGVASIPFVAAGEPFSVSLGSQDDISVVYTRRAEVERRMALSDRRWLLQSAELTLTKDEPLTVILVFRVPVSELAQVRVIIDREKRSTRGMSGPDQNGFVRWTCALEPNRPVIRTLAFRLDRDSNVQLTDPW